MDNSSYAPELSASDLSMTSPSGSASYSSGPKVLRQYTASKKCKLCHGKGSLRYFDLSKQSQLGPCRCINKLVGKIADGLAKNEEIDFIASPTEDITIVIQEKTSG